MSVAPEESVDSICSEDDDTKHEESLVKIKQITGMARHEIAIYEQIQGYREGKPNQILGQVPALDQLIEMNLNASHVKIEKLLRDSQAEAALSAAAEIESGAGGPQTKQEKMFGVKQEDIRMLQLHPKPSKVFGAAPPAKAFAESKESKADTIKKTL